MTDEIDALAKAKARELKRLKEQEQADEKLRREKARIRKLEADYAFRRAVVLGTQVRDQWDKLSHGAQLEIAKLLNAANLSSADRAKLAAYLAVPADEPLDFIPTRPTTDGFEKAAE